MKRVLIYGLGKVFDTYKIIFNDGKVLGAEIVGYSDCLVKNIQPYIYPDEIAALDIDEVVVTSDSYNEIREGLIGKHVKSKIVYYLDYLQDNWDVDKRAVKFLDKSFVDDLAVCKKILGRNPQNFVEIGANFAQDAVLVKRVFGIRDEDVYVFEPHPQIMDIIKSKYNFTLFQNAVGDYCGEAIFNMCDIHKVANNGMSSLKNSMLYNEDYKADRVSVVTMEDMIKGEKISEEIDFVKIDVEGSVYEVLKGFGDAIHKVKIFHCEGDYFPFWENEKLFNDIFDYLWGKGFRMISFHITGDKRETDSLWANTEILDNL